MTGSSLRQEALAIYEAGIAAVEPRGAVRRHLRAHPLPARGRVVVLGVGKAAAAMAAGVEEVLGPVEGLVVVKQGHGLALDRVRVVEASHPEPGPEGVQAAQEMAALARSCTQEDLVLALISGGGSALLPLPLPLPLPGLHLEDLQATTRALLASGAPISAVNTVRRHLSALQGGRLALLAQPATVRSLVLSDVPGDVLHDVASGPTVPDPTTTADALAVLERYRIRLPRVRSFLERADDTPSHLPGARAEVVASNRTAVQASARLAHGLGYAVQTRQIAGEAAEVGREWAAWCQRSSGRRALIAGGESTVTLGRRHGKGGRNQEAALAAALALVGTTGSVILAAGTDGTDGPTDAAGGWADGTSVARARALGLDPARHLREHDAYPLLSRLSDLLHTGPTFTNVMDLHIALAT